MMECGGVRCVCRQREWWTGGGQVNRIGGQLDRLIDSGTPFSRCRVEVVWWHRSSRALVALDSQSGALNVHSTSGPGTAMGGLA